MNTLYVVATPIGHLADLTERAATTLKLADVICVEDKRTSRVLLDHIGARAELLAVHQHNEMQAAGEIIARLAAGKKVALITDAGTPGVSDPGMRVVAAVREAGYLVSPIPGASALAAIISVCGFSGSQAERPILFEGFLPSKANDRAKRLQALALLPMHIVLYESPHRIVETAAALAQNLDVERQVVVGRELTKRFEQIHSTSVAQLYEWLQSNPDHQRGEFVLAIAAPTHQEDAFVEPLLPISRDKLLKTLLTRMPQSQAVKVAEALARDASHSIDASIWKKHWGKGALYDASLAFQAKEES